MSPDVLRKPKNGIITYTGPPRPPATNRPPPLSLWKLTEHKKKLKMLFPPYHHKLLSFYVGVKDACSNININMLKQASVFFLHIMLTFSVVSHCK